MNLIAITGCSRGLGRSICQRLWQRNPTNTQFIIFASHLNNLLTMLPDIFGDLEPIATETKSSSSTVSINCIQTAEFTASRGCRLLAIGLDLNRPSNEYHESLHQLWSDSYSLNNLCATSDLLFIHDAGSLGPLREIGELKNYCGAVDQAIQVNISSFITITSTLMNALLTKTAATNSNSIRLQFVNISSLAAVEPFYSWSIYCAGKAAREHFMRCLLHEYKHRFPRLRVLNYSPGPLDTDMQQMIRQQMVECPLRQQFKEMFEQGKLVCPDDSAEILVRLVSGELKYENGGRLDYYDLLK